jgi:hypothetical protein
VAGELAAVFAAIEAACAARHEPHRVRLVSGLAEGADQLAVRMRPASWEVAAILPFPRKRYEEDFVGRDGNGAIVSDHRPEFAAALEEAADVVELPEGRDGAPAAYARAGALMLGKIDMLVTVWDGREAAGIGGTAQIVAEALEGGIPTLWISSTSDRPASLFSSLSDTKRDAQLPAAPPSAIAKAVETALRRRKDLGRRG